MTWPLVIPLIVLWAMIQKSIVKTTGHGPRSRGSLRYQRRKARKMGVDVDDVPYSPRLTPVEEGWQAGGEWVKRYQWRFGGVAIVLWTALLEPFWKWW